MPEVKLSLPLLIVDLDRHFDKSGGAIARLFHKLRSDRPTDRESDQPPSIPTGLTSSATDLGFALRWATNNHVWVVLDLL